jgi:RNA polymerase sigma-70 factor (ECF subfamily)
VTFFARTRPPDHLRIPKVPKLVREPRPDESIGVTTTLTRRYGEAMPVRGSAERDALLLARIEAGDDRALAEVYDDHSALVFGIARRVTRDEQLACDVSQEVFTCLWELPERVDLTKGSLRGFLAMLAHRRAVDEVRRSERRTRAQASLTLPQQSEGPEEDVVEAASTTWRADRLREVIKALSDEQRTALRLAYFEGLTYRQVADVLGIPEGTAKSRLRLGLSRLRTLLGTDFEAVT